MLKISVPTVQHSVAQDLFAHGLLASKHLDAIDCGQLRYAMKLYYQDQNNVTPNKTSLKERTNKISMSHGWRIITTDH
jgi:hypothetical protein